MRITLPLAALNAVVLAGAVLAAGSGVAEAPSALAPTVLDDPRPIASARASATPATSASAVPAAAPAPAPSASPKAVQPKAPAPTPAAPRVQRVVTTTKWAPYATVGPVTLHLPGNVVEVVGLHQSGHDGALPQSPVKAPARIGRLDSRSRNTNPQGAADIVVDPTRPVRSPVTGTVLRAGTYTLYCDHVDSFLVVEPDARPGWEVKLLHFAGLTVAKGDRVQAGVTVVGANARVLPFASQVDKHTAEPHWPHVHVEVVDPSIPDRPSGRTCD